MSGRHRHRQRPASPTRRSWRQTPCTRRSGIHSRSRKAGHRLPGGPTGSESSANWKTLQTKPTAATNFGVLALESSADPAANLLDVDLATYAKELQQLSATIDATDPDLSAFKRRGGKLIMKVNTTDYTVNPRWVMDYFDKIEQTMGKAW